MTPSAVEASARRRNRLPFGFGPRFFLLWTAGLLLLVPLWGSAWLMRGLGIWDGALLALWLWDLVRLPRPEAISVKRSWEEPLSLATAANVSLSLFNGGRIGIESEIAEQPAPGLSRKEIRFQARAGASSEAELTYTVVPGERGEQQMGPCYLRYRSSFGLAEAWALAPIQQTVCVYPASLASKEQALHLARMRSLTLQKRQSRQSGLGREFETLREYREGDELRDISWSATARRQQLVSRGYTAERSQRVWILVDAGRLLRAEMAGLTKLDYSANAALSLAQVAMEHGDEAGVVVYGKSIQQVAAPDRKPQQVRRVAEVLARARAEVTEADHGKAMRFLLQRQTRRALVIWITDFAETAATPEVIEFAAYLSRRHLVLMGAMGQPDLQQVASSIPQDEAGLFRHAAALEIVSRREILLRNLRQSGVLARELTPGEAVSGLVNEYLRIKDRSLL